MKTGKYHRFFIILQVFFFLIHLQKCKNEFFKKFVAFFQKLIRGYFAPIHVFHPYNNVKIIWDMIHFLIILILLYLIPIQVCFDILISREIELFFTFFFSVDIVISMNTSFFFKGFIVKKRKDIIIAYLKSEFLIDLISLIFYIVDFRDKGNYRFLQYLLMLRWKKLGKINLKLQEKFKIPMKIHPSVIDLINLLFFSFFIYF